MLLLALAAAPAIGQLSGTYTIGSGGDFATMTAAVNALTSQGVSGAVTLNVLNGTYNEQIQIGSISGASAVNTVTFQSQSGSAADVRLTFTPTNAANFVVRLLQADYVTFRNMTLAATGSTSYGIVVKLDGDANNNRLLNNVLSGVLVSAGASALSIVVADGDSLDNTVIDGNTFTNGSYAIYLSGAGLAVRSTGLQITNNTFGNTGFSGIFLRYQNGPQVTRNTMAPAASAARGIEFTSCDGAIQVLRNKIALATSAYGIYLSACDGGSGSPTARGLIANNVVSIGGSGAAYGIYVLGCTNLDYYHNSVNITSTSPQQGQALRIENGGSGINVVNNNLANHGRGYAYVNVGAASIVSTSDHNNLYTAGSYLGYWAGADRATFAAFQAASGKDANSVNAYPAFASSTDLHTLTPWINGQGAPLALVTEDGDGDARDGLAPDIGADEFTPDPSTTTPMAGTYTIGPGGSYATFAAAQADLVIRGVSAPVTFDVLAGVYAGQLRLPEIPGAGPSAGVTFRSQSGDPASVTLAYVAAGAADNYVVRLEGADHLRFENLTLRANTAAGAAYARVLDLFGGVEALSVLGNNITGTQTSANSVNQALLYGENARSTSRTISNNVFTGGSYAAYLDGISQAAPSTGLQVAGNTFAGTGYIPLWMRYHNDPQISGNTVNAAASASRGIELDFCDGALRVVKNRISLAANAIGIFLISCDGGSGVSTPRGLIANNFVSIGGTTTAYGLCASGCTNLDYYHNSVNITSTSPLYGQALRFENGGSGINVVNNVLANQGGGYSYVNAGAASVVGMSDYNDLYTNGNYVGTWGGVNRTTLAAFQAASGREAHSVSVFPHFASLTELRTPSPWLDGRGTPVSPVSDDIDGEPRGIATPDIGADEFAPDPAAMTPLAGTYTIGSGGTYATFAAAGADLLLKGISAPVTFDVLNGTYNEQIALQAVPGADAATTVTFQSQSGNPSGVTVHHAAAGAGDNYVVFLDGADHIRFRAMTLSSGNAAGAPYARVFTIFGGSEDVRIQGAVIAGTQAGGANTHQALVYAENSLCTSRLIDGNTMNDGTYGVAIDGISASVLSDGLAITNNTFTGTGYAPVFCRYQNAIVVNGNTMDPAPSANRGIELANCDGGLQIVKNKVNLAISAYGIYLYACDGGTGTVSPRGLIANNFIGIGGNTLAYGLYINGCTNLDYYNNSVNITSTSAANGQALRIENGGGSGLNIVNNILANPGGGLSYGNFGGASIVATSNNNDLYTTGAVLGYWGGASRSNLAAFQAASSKDAGSVSMNPGFASATNLHRLTADLDDLATPLTAVADDIDAEPRDTTRPDIGADERIAAVVVPSLSINDVSAAEGDAGTTTFDFTVSLSAAAAQTVTVAYGTADGIASAPGDYASAAGTLTFLPGETAKPIAVLAVADAVHEPTETFFVNLSSPANATIADSQGIGTIANDDPEPVIAVNDISVQEGASGTTDAVFTLSLSSLSSQTITVDFATANGTATAAADYAAKAGTATFMPGGTAVRETVLVSGDLLNEADETFFLRLTGAVNASIADSEASATIVNDDVPGADLALVLTDLADPVAAGSTVHYRIDVTNSGPDPATAVLVRDTLPAGTGYQSASGAGWSCSESGGIVTCTVASLAAGAAEPIFIDVTSSETPGTIRSGAVVSSSTADARPADNADGETTTTVFEGIDLSISMLDTPDPVTAGGPLSYAIVVTNAGTAAAGSVEVRDVLPAGMTCPVATGDGWSCSMSLGVMTCVRTSLAPGSSPTITVSCTAPSGSGSISNTASVAASTPDPDMSNNTVTATTTVMAVATPEEAIQNLIGQVNCLIAAGTVSAGNSKALIMKLHAALDAADREENINQLQAFINNVEALVKAGRLSSADGQALIAAANAVIAIFPSSAFGSPDPFARIAVISGGIPGAFGLGQNYPNPFNPSTSIRFAVAAPGDVSMRVYNMLGEEIARLVDGPMPAGTFEVNWTTTGLQSGVYLYRLQTGDFVESKKLILLK